MLTQISSRQLQITWIENRHIDGKQYRVRCSSRYIHSCDDRVALQPTQSIQATCHIELNWVKRKLSN